MYIENQFNNLYNNLHDVKITATVISERKETSYKASYTVKVENINGDKKYSGTKLIIYIPKNKKLEYGDKVLLNGKFERANTATNYKAFDYRNYLKSKNIYGILNVEKIDLLKKDNLNFFVTYINNIRTKIKTNMQEILGENANVAIRNSSSEIELMLRKKP